MNVKTLSAAILALAAAPAFAANPPNGVSYANLNMNATIAVNAAPTPGQPFSIIFTRTAIDCGFFAPDATHAYGPSYSNTACLGQGGSAEAILTQLNSPLVPYHVSIADANTGAGGQVTLYNSSNPASTQTITLNLRINVQGPNSGSHDYASGQTITNLETQQTIRVYGSLATDICDSSYTGGTSDGTGRNGCVGQGGSTDPGVYKSQVNWVISI